MGKWLGLLCAVLLAARAAQGQDRQTALDRGHPIELNGGYFLDQFHLAGSSAKTNGVIGAIGISVTPWMQLRADASEEWGQLGTSSIRIYGNHFGPRIYFPMPNDFHAMPFAEFLVGGSRIDGTASGPGGAKFSGNGFSWKAGGGLDLALSRRFEVSVVDMDYYRTPFFGHHQSNIWLSTGFVIRFGAGAP